VVLAGAFYPNYFVRGAQGGQIDEREAVKVLVGRDPFNTVFFRSMPLNQPGELYAKTIKNYLKDCADDIKVSFDGTRYSETDFTVPVLYLSMLHAVILIKYTT
jgi:ATP-dependent RNA helicase TDRD9